MANVNASLATLTLTPHKAYINNPQTSDVDLGIDGRAVSQVDAGIIGTANLKLDQLVGLKGKLERTSEADAGVSGRASTEVDAGIDGRALAEVGVSLRAVPTVPPKATILAKQMQNFDMLGNAREVYTELHMSYDYDYADAKFRKGLRFFNEEAIARFGRSIKRFDAKWVRSNRDAVKIGTTLLGYFSVPQWKVVFDFAADKEVINLGDEVIPVHSLIDSTRQRVILQADYNPQTLNILLGLEIPAFVASPISVSALSKAFDNVADDLVVGTVENGNATFTIKDPDGNLLVNVPVSLDGAVQKTTDFRGRVTFEATPGRHTLFVDLGVPERNFTVEVVF